MNYGLLDIEMTCDGKQENGKFIDDGRMKHSKREIISVGFVVCDDKYKIKNTYSSFVRPTRNKSISDYCKNLTGITQDDVDHGKKCNDAFRGILRLCSRYSVDYIFTFGNIDKYSIVISAQNNRKKEKAGALYSISEKILDIRPTILKEIGCNLLYCG